ncbi:hypothetical protein TEA_003179 [Camellia sinensis var. sinensis]|uniref:NB-ARC domain-containing protein n=1 Tax=Camellia sinensis var. sinensis TaxID=542762 RepID=A0A4S4EXF6_CAMSN|nr:hypothetical protein TEA_003179 [Camellia sinensis var. sinensis]
MISVIQYLGPLLAGEVELLRGVRKEMVSIKAELERIHSFLKDAESRAETGDEYVKIWVKQVRQVAYRIEDVIDEHILLIQDIKTTICEIKEGVDRYGFSTSTSSEHSSTSTSSITKHNMWRLASLFIGDDEVVGIESPRYELISRLVDKNQSQRAVISVVGMGGIGKTTLAKKIYDSQETAHFNCKAWITISQSYKPEELLKKMIKQLSGSDVLPDEGIESLIDKLRGYLSKKRYIIMFDDVWETDFWGSIRHALPKNSDGSRVIITTRSEQVATFCKETSVDHVHELEALSEEKAWELFCKKAFQLDCPPQLKEVSQAIVRKCQGLLLAIAAIGGLLSTKKKDISEWRKFYDGMNSELKRNPNLKSISKILLFSYNDLPHHLKSCFLYFGIMPEDYSIQAGRLIRLWITEGFVEKQNRKTLEEVAEEYLTELIHRRLTLDLKDSLVRELPFDIGRLRKLRHLLARSHEGQDVGVKIQGGIGGLEELQTIEKMKYLQHLSVKASSDDEILDLQYISSSSPPPYLQRLFLAGRLEKLPDWIPKLQHLVRLSLVCSGLTKNDPLKALQVLPSLVYLQLWDAYDWEQLYFEVKRFQKLKTLTLVGCKGLSSVIIEEGALPLLEELKIEPSPQPKEVPSGIHYLGNLKTLGFVGMPKEFIDRMEPKPKPNQGNDYWIVEHISTVELWYRFEKQSRISYIGSLEEYFNRKVERKKCYGQGR